MIDATMQSEWADFMERDVSPRAPNVQIMEMRKAFYAGMASGMKLGVLRPTEVNVREMKEYIAAEDRRRAAAPASETPVQQGPRPMAWNCVKCGQLNSASQRTCGRCEDL